MRVRFEILSVECLTPVAAVRSLVDATRAWIEWQLADRNWWIWASQHVVQLFSRFWFHRPINFIYRNNRRLLEHDDESHTNNVNTWSYFHIVGWFCDADDTSEGDENAGEKKIQFSRDPPLVIAAFKWFKCHWSNDEKVVTCQRQSYKSSEKVVDCHGLGKPLAIERHSHLAGKVSHHTFHQIPIEAFWNTKPAEEKNRTSEDATRSADRCWC